MSASPRNKSSCSLLFQTNAWGGEERETGERALPRALRLLPGSLHIYVYSRDAWGPPPAPPPLLSLSSCLSWKPQLRAGSRGDRPWPLRHTRLCARHRDGSGVCTPVLPQWTLTSLGEAAAAFAPRIRTAPCDGTSGSHRDVPLLPCAVSAVVPARGRCEKAPRTGRLRPQTLVSPSPGGWTPKAKVSEEGPLPAPQTAAFPSRPHTAQEKGLWCPFPSWSPPPRPDRLPKAPPPDASPWRPG